MIGSPSSENLWWIYALLSALFASLTAIFVKIGVKNIDSDLATAIRTLIILAITWGIVIYKGVPQSLSNLTYSNWVFLLLSGVATGLSWIFYFRAIQIGEVSKVAPVDKMSLALVLLFSVIFLGETLTPKILLGTFLILLGSIVLIR